VGVQGVRSQLVDVAERLVATRGIGALTLKDVQAESGQRNKSVVQYHFGSREGLLSAVVGARMGPVNARRFEVIGRFGPAPQRRDLVEAFVLPLAEQTVLAPSSYWARFLLQASFDPGFQDLVRRELAASSFRAVRRGLISGLADIPRTVRPDRVDLLVEFVLVALAGAERARDEGRMGPSAAARFVADLVDMSCGLLGAPASWARPGAEAGPGPQERATEGTTTTGGRT
jgi:AcrR family transcriptional regulator